MNSYTVVNNLLSATIEAQSFRFVVVIFTLLWHSALALRSGTLLGTLLCCSANCKLAQLAAHSSLLCSIQPVTAMGTIQHAITPMETVFVAILEYLDQGVHSE